MTDTIEEIRARHEGADTYWGKTGSVFDGLQAHADRAVLLARVAELEAALTPPAAVEDGWQPIETAPRDRTRVLISFWLHNKPDGERVSIVAYWVEGEGWMIDQEMQWYPYAPTHWRPLPPPPETKP